MKILIPLDGSKFAEEVLESAAELATNSKAEVHLVRVVREAEIRASQAAAEPIQPALGYGLWGAATPDTGGEYLDDVASRFFPQGSRRTVLVGEDPAREILHYAVEEGVDLIAMATHGRTGLARVVMGSVADKMLRSGVMSRFYLVRPTRLH